MRLFTSLFLLAILGACIFPTEGRNEKCTYAGDTVAFIAVVQPRDSSIVACAFITDSTTHCYLTPPRRYHATDCVVGQKSG